MKLKHKLGDLKDSIVEFFEDNGTKILAGIAAAGAITGMVFGGIAIHKNNKEYSENYAKFIGNISERIDADLKNNDSFKLKDGTEFSVSSISFVDSDNSKISKDARNDMNIYGSVVNRDAAGEIINQESNAYKYTYTFNENFDISKKDDLKKFNAGEIIMELTDAKLEGISALTCGITSENDLTKFTKGLGKINYSNVGFWDNISSPDYFVPYFSTVKAVEKEDKLYGVMKIDGMSCVETTTPNVGLGIAYGTTISNTSGNSTLGVAAGVSMANLAAFENCDTYYTERTLVVELDSSISYTDNDVRNIIVEKVKSKDKSISASLDFHSKSLGEKEMVNVDDLSK